MKVSRFFPEASPSPVEQFRNFGKHWGKKMSVKLDEILSFFLRVGNIERGAAAIVCVMYIQHTIAFKQVFQGVFSF